MNLHEESAQVPMIVSVPGGKAQVSTSMVELLDYYPTLSALCGLKIPEHVQGKDIRPVLTNTSATVREDAFCVVRKNHYMLRSSKWAFIQYGNNGEQGLELYDMEKDPKQHTNLANKPEHAETLQTYKAKLQAKLESL